MKPILSNPKVKSAIRKIAVRAERNNSKTTVDSFYDCHIIEHLDNINHQVIQGRRGTGKTHILKVLQHHIEAEHVHCFFFDCQATGSAGEIADENIPEKHRAIQLMRDFLMDMCSDFMEYFKNTLYTHPNWVEIDSLLTQLHDECFVCEDTINEYEDVRNHGEKTSYSSEKTHEVSGFKPSFLWKRFSHKQKEQDTGVSRKTSGTSYKKIVFPNINKCLDRLSLATGVEFVILIDEWSHLPLSVQPHFAEFLHCCLMSSKHITVKIAVVEARANYSIKKDSVVYGLELGADINADVDLDKLYMFDRNSRKISVDLYKMLWKHLKASGVLNDDIDVSVLIETLFGGEQHPAILLARAAEGNPRDFISIVNKCIIEMNGIGEHNGYITSAIVFQAANSWYRSDKYKALSATQKKILSEISTYVIQTRGNRGFVVDENYLYSTQLSALIDARVMHVLQTQRKFPSLGKGPMAILVLDFGTYSQELLTKQSIHFITNDDCEKVIFSEGTSAGRNATLYPLDGDRKFRMCFLNPQKVDSFPSFFE